MLLILQLLCSPLDRWEFLGVVLGIAPLPPFTCQSPWPEEREGFRWSGYSHLDRLLATKQLSRAAVSTSAALGPFTCVSAFFLGCCFHLIWRSSVLVITFPGSLGKDDDDVSFGMELSRPFFVRIHGILSGSPALPFTGSLCWTWYWHFPHLCGSLGHSVRWYWCPTDNFNTFLGLLWFLIFSSFFLFTSVICQKCRLLQRED